MNRRSQVIWTLVILASLAFQWLVAVLGAGYDHLAGATDSAGNPLGFNDPITNEHIGMMFAQTPVAKVFAEAGWHSIIFISAHLGGLAMIWLANLRPNRLATYFGLQTILFPLGWIPLFWFVPIIVVSDFFTGSFDGESLTDVPLDFFCTHIIWWAISLVATLHGLALADHKHEVKFRPAIA